MHEWYCVICAVFNGEELKEAEAEENTMNLGENCWSNYWNQCLRYLTITSGSAVQYLSWATVDGQSIFGVRSAWTSCKMER